MAVESLAPADNRESNRPYGPPSGLIAVLHRLRSRNLPDRLDVEYLRDAGVPEGSVHRTLFALRFLGLLDGEFPSQYLRAISTSTDEEYQGILASRLREAYRDVFQVLDPATDPQDRFLNFFRRYTPASQRGRMVIFFLGVCREAAIPTLDSPRERGAAASVSGRRNRAVTRGRSQAPASTAKRAAAKRQDASPKPDNRFPTVVPTAGSLLFGVSEHDIALLDEEGFQTVWAALGKIARARSKANYVAQQEKPGISQDLDSDDSDPDEE